MNQETPAQAVVLNEDARLDLTQFAHACGTTVTYVEEMILEGVLLPRGERPDIAFAAGEIIRVRRALRLQRDFDAPLPSVAVMLDLLEEIERLRMQLRREGVEPR
jgi:chaperone modulatory protein CbpM